MTTDVPENKRVSIEEIKKVWSKLYSGEGKPDWSHIFPFYYEPIIFQNSFQRNRFMVPQK